MAFDLLANFVKKRTTFAVDSKPDLYDLSILFSVKNDEKTEHSWKA